LSHKIVEVLLPAQSAMQPVDPGGQRLGIEIHLVPVVVPEIPGVAQKFMHQVRMARGDAEFLQGDAHGTGLGVERVQIDRYQQKVGPVLVGFDVAKDIVVVRLAEMHVPSGLQCRIFPPDTIDPGNQVANVLWIVPVPAAYFIFLRVDILLLAGNALADNKGRPSAVLQEFGEDVRSVRPEVGTKELPHRRTA